MYLLLRLVINHDDKRTALKNFHRIIKKLGYQRGKTIWWNSNTHGRRCSDVSTVVKLSNTIPEKILGEIDTIYKKLVVKNDVIVGSNGIYNKDDSTNAVSYEIVSSSNSETLKYNVGWIQLFFSSGAKFQMDFENDYLNDNSLGSNSIKLP